LENLGISPEEMNRKIQTARQLVQTQTLFTRELATLSGGEKQKAALTVLLAMNPDILLLDEPFASIDPTSRKQFIQILARLHQAGKTILVCDHDFNDYADVVDQVVTLKNGQFEKQPLTFIKTKPQTFQLTTSVVKQPMLQLKNFRLSQGKRVLLEEKEALLFKGITTLTGPNGAGKSTLLKA
ncbi:ABC transporter ATP-binding protein, partial [Enterococcus faecium]|uniref:ABC transporter ATP-binding protein n=1 Tax=Enterococcus faecium TaxID=1352 RepID=UPI0030C8539B